MSLFHFDVRFGDTPWSEDDTGSELDGLREARNEAVDLARGLAKDHLDFVHEIAVRVRNGTAEPLFVLRLCPLVEELA
jgi:hypothetical protein